MSGRDFLRLQNHYSSQHEAAFIHTYKKAADDAGLNIDEYHNKLNG
ncbi:MAG: hypothetical protein MJ200_05865 [Mycoplasmoidaceae bacterium]|nr:hypothetical protein [Mycoplasmoidaceae bacterium]